MWKVWGTIAPTSLHIAQIHHLIWRTLTTGTCRHTRRQGQPGGQASRHASARSASVLYDDLRVTGRGPAGPSTVRASVAASAPMPLAGAVAVIGGQLSFRAGWGAGKCASPRWRGG
jgi:hypothetical protein